MLATRSFPLAAHRSAIATASRAPRTAAAAVAAAVPLRPHVIYNATASSSFSTSAPHLQEAPKSSSSTSTSEDDALLQRLKDELKAAMKGKQPDLVSILKPLLSEHQLASKSAAGAAGSAAVSLLSLVRKHVARRTEAAKQYTDAQREDLASKEHKEAGFLQRFLPRQMDEEELEGIVGQVMDAARGKGIDGKKLMGSVIREVKEVVGGKAEGAKIKEVVEKVIKSLEGK